MSRKPCKPAVLIVDDDPTIREMASAILRHVARVRTYRAATNAEGLRKARRYEISAVISDLGRPRGGSGFEFLRAFRKAHPKIPVIISSGSATLEDVRLVDRLGAFAFLPKAYKCEELVKVVMDALRSARGITTLVVALLAMAVMSGSLSAADTNRLAVPGRDDMSRYIGAKAKPGERCTERDASGRALGTAVTAGTRTRFRDSGGRTTGSATVEGNRKVFRDASGRMVGAATASGGQTTYRDAAGRAQGTSLESGGKTTFRDAGGRATSTVQKSGSNMTFRDNSGRPMGSSSTTGAKDR
jgi:DNA-binding NarL/FixJ family response regulator